jgi:hypothetical protein
MKTQTKCSCGTLEDHIVARRKTLDGICILVWNDGKVTDRMCRYLPGCSKKPKDISEFSDRVSLYNLSELPAQFFKQKGVL